MVEVLPRRKLRDEVAERLKNFIATQKLQPGDRLPTETELAEKFGVSRLSLREATKALEFLGIVEAKTGVGLTVGQLDFDRVSSHLGFHPALHRADPIQLIDSRVIIEVGVLPHVIRRVAEESSRLDPMRKIVDEFRSTRSISKWIALDIRFHSTLLEISGLTPIIAFGELLEVFFQRFRDSIQQSEWKSGVQGHQRLLELIERQRLDEAESELRTHIESHKTRLECKP